MKNITLATVFIFLVSFGVFAQKSDSQVNSGFEGTWILEDADFDYPYSYKEYSEIFSDVTLTISLNKDQIKIIKNYRYKDEPKSQETTLFLDKRGEENPMLFGENNEVNIKSETYSKKDSIIREYKFAYPGYISERKEIYKLSDDGKTLTVKHITKRNISPSLIKPSAHGLSKGSLTDKYDRFIYRKR